MQCPYCNQKMQKGSITENGRSKLYWQPDGQKLTFFDKLSGTGVIKAAKYTLASFSLEANYCASCKKIIFETDIEK